VIIINTRTTHADTFYLDQFLDRMDRKVYFQQI